jgi:hypothetical protein
MTTGTEPAGGVEPNLRIKQLAVLLLRVGLGINLLNEGLMGYLTVKMNAGAVGLPTVLPYVQIAIGVALILGFVTTMAATCAGVLVLFHPLVQTLALFGGTYNPFGRGPFALQANLAQVSSTGNLLITAAVLWFSSPGQNPWSLDAMVFGRRASVRESSRAAAPPMEQPPEPAPSPGQRTAAFLSHHDEFRGKTSEGDPRP